MAVMVMVEQRAVIQQLEAEAEAEARAELEQMRPAPLAATVAPVDQATA